MQLLAQCMDKKEAQLGGWERNDRVEVREGIHVPLSEY